MPRTANKLNGQSTIRDVANRALVSIGTASRVFNNYPNVEADLRIRVLKAANELGYVHRQRNGALFRLDDNDDDNGHTITHIAFCCRAGIGSATAPLDNPYFSLVLHGVEAECRRQKLHLLYYVLEDDPRELTRARSTLSKSGAEAILLVNFTNEELVSDILKLDIPTVLIDHYFHELPLDVVMNENFAGTVRAVQHLIQAGHRRIGFLDGSPHYTIERRREGYRAALEKAGIGYDPDLVVEGDLSFESGLQAAEIISQRKLGCTAYFCANDQSAIGLIQGLAEQGLRVPDDISVVGFDDVEAAKLISPPLTTVRANAEQLGRMAVRRLLDRVKDPTLPVTQTLLHSTLVERRSVRTL